MTRRFRLSSFVAVLLAVAIGTGSIGSVTASAQGRLRRAPERDLESTPLLPSGARELPQGTVIILEMDDKLSSNTSRVSDKFRAHVASPVADQGGKTLIPAGIIVEGHVASVSKAKWAHRSGIIGIVFDNFRSPEGKPVPLRATLTSADPSDRKQLDEEGYVKGGNPTKRDIVFIGGGAGIGAGIGAITGGILMGGAIGAAAGATTTLLLKGKEAIIPPGHRFGMELVQPFSLASNPFGLRSVTPIPNTPVAVRPKPAPTPYPDNRPRPGALDPYDVLARRQSDGSVQLFVNALTPSQGWRVFTNHEVSGDRIRVRLRGTPPANSSNTFDTYLQQSSTARAPEICEDDRNGSLRRAEILDKNGRVKVAVDIPTRAGETRSARASDTSAGGSGSGGYSPQNPPYYNRPTTNPPVINPPTTNSPTSSAPPPALAQSVVNQVEVIRAQYSAILGYFLEADGNYRFIGSRQPTTDQRQLLDSLGSLLNSLRELRANASNPYTRRNSALRVQEDVKNTQQVWLRVPMDASLNTKWTAAYRDINTLLGSTLH